MFFKIWINNIHYFLLYIIFYKLGPFCREYERAYYKGDVRMLNTVYQGYHCALIKQKNNKQAEE